jgi:hypothetical protein
LTVEHPPAIDVVSPLHVQDEMGEPANPPTPESLEPELQPKPRRATGREACQVPEGALEAVDEGARCLGSPFFIVLVTGTVRAMSQPGNRLVQRVGPSRVPPRVPRGARFGMLR